MIWLSIQRRTQPVPASVVLARTMPEPGQTTETRTCWPCVLIIDYSDMLGICAQVKEWIDGL